MPVCLVLAAHGCFDPTDLDGDAEVGTGASSGLSSETDPTDGVTDGMSVTVTDSVSDTMTGGMTDPTSDPSSDSITTQPTSLDTSAGSDPTTDDTASTTTDSGPSEDSSTSAGVHDMGVPGPCDTFDPDCPEGFKCNAYADDGGDSWNALFCFPLDRDPAGVGQSCMVEGDLASGVDNCEFGSMCWDVDPDTNVGTCVEFCGGSIDDPTCADFHTCVSANDQVLNLCLPFCDPLLQDCSEGQACYPFNEAFICAVDASGENGADGEECEYINVCDPGLFCAATDVVADCASLAGCCTPFCDASDPIDGCPSSQEDCIPWFAEGEAPPGFEDVGACVMP
jgi:hypothetical protein